ncbi:MFS transporter [Candidatus Contubernalis alkaliaceticus]|uniref:MFS transporter n=1 Tax=Candidatus Contubernalis alkaliaceticus TaxID=338645 RepID=UPI001F4BD08F|nr:MFS transporter [Candidatus Contubernalis alkalaceticus]UNC91618.1 MFS transporter [Candidatus Contubernalis alkalaceticus]
MQKQHKNNKILLVLSTVPFLMVLGNSMLIPEFNTIKNILGINQLQVGLLITFFSASAAITIPFVGYFSDLWGRKNIIVPGILLYGLGGILSGTAAALVQNPYYYILAGRVVQGVGAAGTAPIAMALAGDLFPIEERSESMGAMEAANGLGKAISPIIGSATALLVWYAIFFSYALLSIPIALMIWFWVKEPLEVKSKNSINYFQDINLLFIDKGIYLLINFTGGLMVLLMLFGALSFSSDIIVNNFDLWGISRGLILSVPLLSLGVTAYLTGLYLKKKTLFFRHSFLLGFIILSFSMFIFPLCIESPIIFPVMLGLLGVGSGLVLPATNTMITGASKSSQRGSVTALYGSARFIGIALGPPVFSLLQMGDTHMFSLAAGLSLLIGILGFYYLKEK